MRQKIMKRVAAAMILTMSLLSFFSKNGIAQKNGLNKISWSVAASLPSAGTGKENPGVAGSIAGISGNTLIVAGGANFPDTMPWEGGKKVYHDAIYLFQKKSGTIAAGIISKQKLPQPVAYCANVTTPDGIIYLGGENQDGISDKVRRIRYDELTGKVTVSDLCPLPVPLTNLSAVYSNNNIYIAGGEYKDGASARFFSLNLSVPYTCWQTLPDIPKPVSHAVMAAQFNGDHNCIYLIGGRRKDTTGISEIYNSVYQFDLKTNQWIEKQSLPYRVSAATGIATGSSYILLFSGDKGGVFSRVEGLNAAISSEKDEARKQELIMQKNILLTSHPGFTKETLLYNTVTDTWTPADSLSFDGQVTTTAFKWGDDIIIPSGEIKAGVRTPHIIRGSVSKKHFFSWLDILVLIVCFLLMTVARYFFTSHKTTSADYFKGGQKIPKWAAGISIFGAKLSAITFMGIPAKTYGTNWTYFFLLMTIIMVMPIVAKYFIPFYRKLNVTSAYEYLDRRFNYGSRIIASILYILLQLGRMAIVVLLPSIALTLVTGIDINLCIVLIGAISIFFTVKGGIEAVIWVEVVQVLILACGALLCLFYIPFCLNDSNGAAVVLNEYDKLKLFDFRFDFTEPTLWVVIIGGLAMNLVTYGTDQTTVQRYLTTKTEKEAVKSLKLGAWLALPSTLVFFTIGTLLFLFFRQQPEEVNFSLNNQDNIFPWFIVSQLPAGLSGLLIAGIFAAAMSSTEASMNSVATLLTADFYKKIKPATTEKQTLFFARITTLLLGLFVTGISLYMAEQGVSSLWDKFMVILGLFTGSIGGVFLLGIFTRRANGAGAVMGMIASCITQLFVQGYTSIHLLMYALTGLISCVIFGYLFSLFFENKKSIEGLTWSSIKKLKAEKEG